MYINEEKSSGVIFNYLVNNRFGEGSKLPIKLKGLEPTRKYQVQEINLYPGTTSELKAKTYTGDFLMNIGFDPIVNSGRSSVVVKFTELQ